MHRHLLNMVYVCASSASLHAQDTFIGFGGNVVREKVREGAPWFVSSFRELIQELED